MLTATTKSKKSHLPMNESQLPQPRRDTRSIRSCIRSPRSKTRVARLALLAAMLLTEPPALAVSRIPAPKYGVERMTLLSGTILAVSFSPDNRTLALVEKRGAGAKVTVLTAHDTKLLFTKTFQSVPSLAFSDANNLIVASPRGKLYQYSLPSGRLNWERPIGPKSSLVAAGAGRMVLKTPNRLEILHARSGVLIGSLPRSQSLARSPRPAVWIDSKTVLALDRKHMTLLSWSQNRRFPTKRHIPGCSRPPILGVFSPDGRHLALICPTASQKQAIVNLSLVLPTGAAISSSRFSVSALLASSTMNLSVSDGQSPVMAWGLWLGGALVQTARALVPMPSPGSGGTLVALSGNGRRLAMATGRSLTIYCRRCPVAKNPLFPRKPASLPTLPTKNRVVPFLGGQRYIHAHKKKAYALALTQTALVTSGADGTLGLFDRWSGRRLGRAGRPGPVHTEWVEASPDRSKLVAGWGDGHLSLHDGRTGRVILTWPAHPNAVFEAHFSKDGRRILSCGQDGIARIWDVATGRNLALVPHPGAQQQRLTWASSATDSVNTTAFHPTKSWVAVGTPNGDLAWVDWKTGRVVQKTRIRGQGVMSLLPWKQGDRILATTTSSLCLWEGRSKSRPRCITTMGSNIGMTWVQPYRIVAVGTANPTPGALLVDVTDMKILRRLPAKPRPEAGKIDVAQGRAVFDLEFDPQLGLLHGTLQSGWVVTWRLVP